MKLDKSLFLIPFFLTLAPYAPGASLSPADCRILLTTLIEMETTGAGHDREWPEELRKRLDDASAIQGVDSVPFSEFESLVPLFDSAIVHKAVAQELISQKLQSKGALHLALDAFKFLSSDEQIKFVDGVILRLLYSTSDVVSLEPAQLFETAKKASSYNMTPQRYFEFIHALKTQRQSNFVAIKVAIFKNLLDGGSSFTKRVTDFGGRWYTFNRVWRTEKVLTLPPLKQSSSFSALVTEESTPYPTKELAHFLESAPAIGATYFVETNYLDFSLAQLESILAQGKNFKLISSEDQAQILKRIEFLKTLAQKHHALVASVETLENLDRSLEAEKAVLAEFLNVGDPVSDEEMKVVKDMINATSGYSYASDVEAAIKVVLKSYNHRLNADQYAEVAIQSIRRTNGFSYASDVNSLIGMVQGFAGSHVLSDDSVTAIRGSITARIKSFSYASDAQDGLKLIGRAWGKPKNSNQPVLSLAEGQSQLRTLEAQLAKNAGEKSKLLAEIEAYRLSLDTQTHP